MKNDLANQLKKKRVGLYYKQSVEYKAMNRRPDRYQARIAFTAARQ